MFTPSNNLAPGIGGGGQTLTWADRSFAVQSVFPGTMGSTLLLGGLLATLASHRDYTIRAPRMLGEFGSVQERHSVDLVSFETCIASATGGDCIHSAIGCVERADYSRYDAR
jgi:hypothetical protein